MALLDATGYTPKILAEYEQEIADSLRTQISPSLNTTPTSPLGQVISVFANQLATVDEALQALYTARDPAQAAGDALTAIARLVGVERLAATKSTVLMTIVATAATYTPGSLVFHVAGDTTLRFSNPASVVHPGGSMANVPFESEDTGPVRANAGTLTVIASPVAGLTSGTNPADAVLGTEQESDLALRARWADQLARAGSTTVDAIRADVLQVAGVTFARVVENDTDSTIDSQPPHSFEVLALGGADADIAEAIFATKPAGIRAYGTTTQTVTDSQGSAHTIGFSRPTDVSLYLAVTVSFLGGQFVGGDALKVVLADWGDANLGPGNDAIHARLLAVVMSQAGVVDATVAIGIAPSPTAQVNYVIGARQIARLDTLRINVVASSVTGTP